MDQDWSDYEEEQDATMRCIHRGNRLWGREVNIFNLCLYLVFVFLFSFAFAFAFVFEFVFVQYLYLYLNFGIIHCNMIGLNIEFESFCSSNWVGQMES